MIRVSRTDVKKGTTRELFVTDKCWKRIVAVPTVFGANIKWEKVKPPPATIFDPGAPHKPHDDMAEAKQKPPYNDESYKYDCDKGKELFSNGEYTQALEFLNRAINYQPRNQYIRKLIKEIKDGKSTTD